MFLVLGSRKPNSERLKHWRICSWQTRWGWSDFFFCSILLWPLESHARACPRLPSATSASCFLVHVQYKTKKEKKRGGLLIAFKSEKELLETPVILSLVAKNWIACPFLDHLDRVVTTFEPVHCPKGAGSNGVNRLCQLASWLGHLDSHYGSLPFSEPLLNADSCP